MIVAGRVVMKMLPVLQRIWQQMHEPKWCISMGACASTGGVFDTYCVVQGIDRFIPVDMYIPGCPPRPEQLIQGIIDLQDKIQREGTLMCADTTYPDIGLQLFDPRDGIGQPRMLCASGSSNVGAHWDTDHCPYDDGPIAVYAPQHTHPHPTFSPGGSRVVFTSDRSGYAQVYEVQLPRQWVPNLSSMQGEP